MGILINTGFDLGSSNPLDDWTVKNTIDERDALVTDGLAYESLRTYVTSEKKWYEYDGYTWNEIIEKGDKGDNGEKGDKGDVGVSVTSIEQTTVSTESEGINVITCTLDNGTTSEFQVRNGEQGLDGYALIPTTQLDNQIGRIWLAN